MLSLSRPLTLMAAFLPLLLSGQIGFDPSRPQLTAPAGNTPPEQRCIVTGRVTNAQTGESVRKANIRLIRRAGQAVGMVGGRLSGAQGYSSASDADGNFRIENVEPGDYLLAGSRAGFLDTQYGAKKPMQPGTVISLKPSQQITDIALGLIPQAVITGKIVDSDGDPVNGATIQVLAQQWMRGKLRYSPRSSANTNDLGEYRIANLSPGKYYLSAQKLQYGFGPNGPESVPDGKPDIRPIRTFYPEALTLESATPIEIRAGQDLSGIDVRLHSAQTYHVRGKIAGSVPESDQGRVNLSVSNRDDYMPMHFGGQTPLKKDGSFDIAGVAPGSYNLNVFVMNGPVRTMASQAIEVGAADVNDVLVAIVPPGTITGQIRLEGTPQAASAAVNLQSSQVGLWPAETGVFLSSGRGQTNPDGSFTIQNVNPGKYFVSVNPPPGTYTKSILYGQTDVNGKELDLTQGASGELQVVFRYGTAEVDGTIQTTATGGGVDSSGSVASAPSASIVLVPDTLNADGSGMRIVNTTNSSSFVIKNVPPGHYRAYAFEVMNYGTMQNPDVMRELQSRGAELEVRENDKKQIQVPLIPAEELQQVLAKLGLEVP